MDQVSPVTENQRSNRQKNSAGRDKAQALTPLDASPRLPSIPVPNVPAGHGHSLSRMSLHCPSSDAALEEAQPRTPSGGKALDPTTRAFMQDRFQHDFSAVRIHEGGQAAEAARSFKASAYTHGNDIVMGSGQSLQSSAGKRLLAHELTHVVQQDRYGAPAAQKLSRRGDASEAEAHSVAAQIVAGQSVQVSAAPSAAIARDDEDDNEGGAPVAPSADPLLAGGTIPIGGGPDTIPDPAPPTDFTNPQFPKAPRLPNIPEPPPGGFAKPPVSPVSPTGGGGGAAAGGGFLGTVESILGAIGGAFSSFLPPIPKSILHPEDDHEA